MKFLKYVKKWKIILPLIVALGLTATGGKGASAIIGYLIFLAVCLIPAFLEWKYMHTPAEKLWRKWESVEGTQQDKRRNRAKFGDVTPAAVSPELKVAVFVGSTNKRYRTTLRSCTCPDFQKRKVPCKHMYYLADKCGLE